MLFLGFLATSLQKTGLTQAMTPNLIHYFYVLGGLVYLQELQLVLIG